MKTQYFVASAATVLAFITGPAFADPCSDQQMGHVVVITEAAARNLVSDHFLGGKHIAAAVTGCQYASADDIYTVAASITWNGALISSNEYQVDALVRIKGNAAETVDILRGSDRTQELSFWGKLAGKTIEVVSAVR